MFGGCGNCMSIGLEPYHRIQRSQIVQVHLKKLKSLQSNQALGYLLSCQDQAADENCDQGKNCASPKNASSGESSLKTASEVGKTRGNLKCKLVTVGRSKWASHKPALEIT